jgi:uncharacterized protein (TIGR02147 family)
MTENQPLEGEAFCGEFRTLLRETMINRTKSNPAYSLRAFAKHLQFEPSFLSKLLSGKRNFTEGVILKLASRLSLDPELTSRYVERAREAKPSKVPKTQIYRELELDQFRIVADWYHYAILELLLLKNFRANPSWIAKKLGISKFEAESALERLIRAKMIRQNSETFVNTPDNHTTLKNAFSDIAFRKLQEQILRQALQALENTPIEERDQSSMTMAIDKSLLPEAKKRIRAFRRQLTAFLQENKRPKDEVYQLSISFFPVTDGNRND